MTDSRAMFLLSYLVCMGCCLPYFEDQTKSEGNADTSDMKLSTMVVPDIKACTWSRKSFNGRGG